MKPRTIILGIDALGFNQVRRFVNQGLCPNFLELNRTGYTAGLVPSVPPTRAAAWASLVTGKWPGRHGIFHSLRSEYAGPGSYRRRRIDSRYLASRALPIWDIFEQNGIACGLYRVPCSSPLPRVSGFGVGPDEAVPTGLRAELAAAAARADDGIIREMFGAGPDEYPEPLRGLVRELAGEREEILHLVRTRREVPFQWYVSTALDRIQHRFDRFHAVPNHPHPARDDPHESATPAAALRHIVPAAHCWYDRLVGEIRAELEPDEALMVVSGYGSSPVHQFFSLNHWLRKEGYLVLTANHAAARGEDGPEPLDRVDWDQTRSCSIPGFGLIINRKGREPRGTVAPAEYAKLRDELAAALRAIRAPHRTQPVMHLHYPEEIYEGRYVHQAPDLVVTSNARENGGVVVCHELAGLAERPLYAAAGRISAAHDTVDDEQGVCLAAGPGFTRAPGEPGPWWLVDLVPNLCLRFGIPLPDDGDGWFYANLAPGVPTIVMRPYPPAGSDRTPAEERQIASRIRDLGGSD